MPPSEPNYGSVTFTHRLGFFDLLRLSFRVFRTKLLRTILTIAGMSVGIGTVLFLVSLGYGLQYILIGRLVTTEDSLITLEALFPPEVGKSITPADLEELRNLPDVAELSPIAEFFGELKKDVSGIVSLSLVRDNYFRLSGVKPDFGEPFTADKPGLVVSKQTLTLMNLPVNNSSLNQEFGLKVIYNNDEKAEQTEITLEKPIKLLGILTDDSLPQTVIVPVSLVSQTPPFYSKVLIKARNIDVVEKLRDELINKGYFISAKIDLVNQARQVLRSITVTLGVFGITALFVAAIGMFNTMIVGFLERIYEVGIMKSLGATNRDIRNLFLMESSLLGFLGGVGGILMGVGVGQLGNLLISYLSGRLGGDPIQLFLVPGWFMGVIIVISIIIGMIAGFWPAHRAQSLSPKEAFVRK